jgi:hypothetical protein
MTARWVALVVAGGLAALLLARVGRWHEPDQPTSPLASASWGRSGPTGTGRAAPPRFAGRSDQPVMDKTAERERRHQRLGKWLRGDALARERALEGFVRETGLDPRSADRLRQLARGASQTARTVDRLGDRTRLPAAALVDDTEAVLRWILSEDQWALFCERVLDQRT